MAGLCWEGLERAFHREEQGGSIQASIAVAYFEQTGWVSGLGAPCFLFLLHKGDAGC